MLLSTLDWGFPAIDVDYMRLYVFINLLVFYAFFGSYFISAPTYGQNQEAVFVDAPQALGSVGAIQRDPDSIISRPVSERVHPDFQAVPIHWAGFVLYPSLTLAQKYGDNIFATDDNTESDLSTKITPSLSISKEFGRHVAGLSLEGDIVRFWDNDDENIENFRSRFSGFLEARHDIILPFEVSYNIGHEKRSQNFSSNFTTEPVRFNTFSAAFGANYAPNRFALGLIGRYNQIQFDDGINADGEEIIRRDGDRRRFGIELRGTYDLEPNHTAFASIEAAQTDYFRPDFIGGSFSGVERDSNSLIFLTGLETDYKGLITGRLGIGYSMRDFDDSTIDDIDAFKLDGNLLWNVTKLATIGLNVGRQISEDSQIVSGSVVTQGTVSFDYEILRNLLLNTYFDYAKIDFAENDREDTILGAGLGLEYIISPRFSASLDYDFRNRESSSNSLDFDRNEILIRANTRF